ncbi:DNA polymerase III subunit beta [bacterium]|nr:MAG: DNA polymerase III subunit beta [bacterium]
MKVIITQENLKNGLQTVSRVVGNSSTLPILNNVMLETDNGLLKISGTNLETGISTYVRCKVESEGGICVGVKTISDLINSLPSENITLESGELETAITTDNSNVKIKHLPTEDFPLIPKIEDSNLVKMNALELKSALDQVIFASSTSETQPEISGVLFWFGGENVLITATDRYRLAEKKIPYQGSVDLKIIIPHRSASEISRLLTGLDGEVEISVTTTQLAFNLENTYIVTRLVDGSYPDYQQIIPDTHNTTVIFDRNDLNSALKTSSVFSKGSGSITINYDSEKNTMQLNSVSHDLGESKVDVVCRITGPSGTLVVNYRYLTDFLNNLNTDTLVMKIIDENEPITFVPESDTSYLYLVMPIKQQ